MPSMRRSRARFAVVLVGVAVFALVFALYLREELRGGPWRTRVLLTSPSSPAEGPRVVRYWTPRLGKDSALRIGDELRAVGGQDLLGAPPWVAYAAMFEAAGRDGRITVRAARGGAVRELEEQLDRGDYRRDAAMALLFVVVVLAILRRAAHSPFAWALAVASVAWAIAQIPFFGSSPGQTHAYFAGRTLAGCLWAPLALRAALRFPDEVWLANPRPAWWPWLFAPLGITWLSWWMDAPLSGELAARLNPLLAGVAIAAILSVGTRNFRHAGPEGRRQLKWVLLGFYLGLVPSLLGTVAGTLRPDLVDLWFATQASVFVIPIFLFIAVTRSGFLDIDRLISGTASYSILVLTAGALALTGLPRAGDAVSRAAGVDPEAAQVVLAALLALLVFRLEPLLRRRMERIFFKERQRFQEGIDRLAVDVHATRDPAALATLVGERLDDLLRPEFLAVYAVSEAAFAPVFARRCRVTPLFETKSSLVRALAARPSALDLEVERELVGDLDARDRARLSGLRAAALVPVVRDGTLLGFLALGPRSSGDTYTSADLALLSLLGSSIAAAIRRFGDEQLLREAQALQERLRRFVPASVADQLARSGEVEAGEREVTVLFADLRGYTRLAEGRLAEEVFRLVSRYADAVSRAVTEHGGTVVEFNGDGVMAVFGAPEPLAHKERCALLAARRIVADVSTLAPLESRRSGAGLRVGVGLATGPAYVGAIESAGRQAWCALGSTTNLAARLEELSRTLGASVVADRPTHEAAGAVAADMEPRAGVRLRGFSHPHELFVLPSGPARVAQAPAAGRGRTGT